MVNSEQKTSNYLETNLVPVDRAATSNLGMLESDGSAAAVAGTDRPVKMDADWLFCVRRRESVMRKILSLMVGISLIALIYFIISSALSASHVTQVLTCCCHVWCSLLAYQQVTFRAVSVRLFVCPLAGLCRKLSTDFRKSF